MATATSDRAAQIEQLHDLIDGINIAQLTTVRSDGTIHSRPMATQELQGDGTLWYLTSRSSAKVDELRADQHVHVGYSDTGKSTYVSVSGRGTPVEDRARIEEFWSPMMKAWWDGPDDPEIVLVRVDVSEAEYWDTPRGGKPVQLFQIARQAITGRHAGLEDEHGTLSLN